MFLVVVVVDPLVGIKSLLVLLTALFVFLLSVLLFVAVAVVHDSKKVLYLMRNRIQSSSRIFPPPNVCFHVDESVRKILLKLASLQIFSYITKGRKKSARYGETVVLDCTEPGYYNVLNIFRLVLDFNSSVIKKQIRHDLAIRRNFQETQYDFYNPD